MTNFENQKDWFPKSSFWEKNKSKGFKNMNLILRPLYIVSEFHFLTLCTCPEARAS